MGRRHYGELAPADGEEPICALCGRSVPPTARASRHHLTPKLKGGAHTETVLLHQVCHAAIHARFSEAELARRLFTVEALRNHPDLAEFLAWIRTKPPDFYVSTRSARTRSRKWR